MKSYISTRRSPRSFELAVAANYNLGIGPERQKYTCQEIAEYYGIGAEKLAGFSGTLDYRPDFSTYSEVDEHTYVYVLEVSSRKLPEERRTELLKKTKEFCEFCSSTSESHSFVPVLVHLPSGPSMSEAIDNQPHFKDLSPDLKSALKGSFKALNFIMQYALNKCAPEFCSRVIAMGTDTDEGQHVNTKASTKAVVWQTRRKGTENLMLY